MKATHIIYQAGIRPALDGSLNRFRKFLGTTPLLSRLLRVPRAILHFGPWRVLPRAIIRVLRPPVATSSEYHSCLPNIDIDNVVASIERDSVAIAGVLDSKLLNKLLEDCRDLTPDHYQLVHEVNEDFLKLSQDPGILHVLREYFGSEPALLESTLLVTGKKGGARGDQADFHFDFAGWQSLNVMVYLTDVDAHNSPHVVARGSHRDTGWLGLRRGIDAFRGKIVGAEAQRRFAESAFTVTGKAGTVFFENTEAYHHRVHSEERRVMLNLLYASHRSLMSHGRTSRWHKTNRRRLVAG